MRKLRYLTILGLILLASYSELTAQTAPKAGKSTRPASASKSEPGTSAPTYRLISARKDGSVDLVEKEMEIAGKLIYEVDPRTVESVATPTREEITKADGTKRFIQRVPMKINGTQKYEECFIQRGNTLQGELSKPTLGAWHFLEDSLKMELDSSAEEPKLNAEKPLLAVEISDAKTHIFRPGGTLTREELDIVNLQANTLLLDFMLPNRADIKIGDSWKQSPDVMGLMLQLDLVFQLDIRTKLAEVNTEKNLAILETSGWIEGSSDGTASKIEVDGKMYFDLKRGRIRWFGLIVRESRAAGYVAPGMEVAAQYRFKITPRETSEYFTDQTVSDIAFDPQTYDRLEFRDPGGLWAFQMTTDWYAVNFDKSQSMFRLVKGGELIAQCSTTVSPDPITTQKIAIEEFSENIQDSLKDYSPEITESSVIPCEDGTQMFRVVVTGSYENELPLRWIYYLITKKGDSPRQLTVVFTFEDRLLDQFGTADQTMMETFGWME